ncbi:MAG: hypothetical protein KAY24_01855 [Candidatus Eisenbacteria sp.]|nr:hypothetical protein [Candidatus Eisenbacteria bacterium]
MPNSSSAHDLAAEQFILLVIRTLRLLYVAFWVSVLICAGVVTFITITVKPHTGKGLEAASQLPRDWDQWQFLFVAAGLVCVYLMYRLGHVLLRPERFWHGARNLRELAAQLDPAWSSAAKPSLTPAVQHLFGRIVIAHAILWAVAEIPMILGLVDQFVSGSQQLMLWMTLLSALALIIRRPQRSRIQAILERGEIPSTGV